MKKLETVSLQRLSDMHAVVLTPSWRLSTFCESV